MMDTYLFWLLLWKNNDYNDDELCSEISCEEMADTFGTENIQTALQNDWVNIYTNDWDEEITEFPTQCDDLLLYIHGDAMAESSRMLLNDPEFEEELELISDKWGHPYLPDPVCECAMRRYSH